MKWKIEKGTIEAEIGGSSEDIRLSGAFEIVENGWVAGRDRAFYCRCDSGVKRMVKNRKLLAEQLVEESVVLLKNENQLLPLQEGQTVAVFGRSALVTYVSGNGSGAARGAESSNIIIELEKAGISVCEELKQYYLQQREAEAANPQEKFDFSQMKEAVNSGLMYEIFGTYHAPVPEYPIPECLLTNVRDRTNTAILVLGRNAGGEECDRRLEGDYYLTEEEKKLVSQVCENFPEVIVTLM